MKERLVYIDILRAMAIFLVTLGHVAEYGGYGKGLLHGVIYSFHMPLFFAISGFVSMYAFRMSDPRLDVCSFFSFIWKRFRLIMIPYFVWNLIVHPFALASRMPTWEAYAALCRSVFVENTSAWFLPCLFGLLIVLALHRLVFGNLFPRCASAWVDVAGLGILFGCVAVGYHFTGNPFLRSIVSYAIPFSVGALMGRYAAIDQFLTECQGTFWVSLALFAVFAGLFVASDGSKVLRLAAGLSSIPVFFTVAKNLSLSRRFEQSLCCVGQNTLAIYCLQNWARIPDFSMWHLTPILQFLIFGAIAVVVMALVVFFARLIGRNFLLRQVLLGRV